MLGALIGDIAGSRFEWHNHRSKDFELLTKEKGCKPTDDSYMSLAVAQAILDCGDDFSRLGEHTVKRMQELGRKYPDGDYGGRFGRWLYEVDPRPYHSFGNGAAMRVSACGFAAGSRKEAITLADAVTEVTHDHPEGMKGAEAVAEAIRMAREGCGMAEIRKRIEQRYYTIGFTLDEIRADYAFDETCQGSVPQALEAFFESTTFEDAIRNAISIGGDSDTVAAITGGVAEAYYGIPDAIREKALTFLDAPLLAIQQAFEKKYGFVADRTI